MTETDGLPASATPASELPVELPQGRAYLSLGEVLDALKEQFPDVTIAKIRFFEAQGLLIPERTPSGYRKFFPADIERLRLILADQEERYVPLNAARAAVSEVAGAPRAPVDTGRAETGFDRAPLTAENGVSQAHRQLRNDAMFDAMFDRGDGGDGGDGGEPDDEANYDGVDLGSDRHPSLRGRREPGPRLTGRRVPAETRPGPTGPSGPSAAAAVPSPNVAPLRRARPGATPTAPTMSFTEASGAAEPSIELEPASFSRSEVMAASGASEALFDDAVQQSFVRGRMVLGITEFDEDDRRLLEALVTLGGSGLDPRHVRVFMHAAQREADLYVQATLPLLRRRPQLGVSVDEPFRRFSDLEAAGATLRGVVVRRALRAALDGAPGPTPNGG